MARAPRASSSAEAHPTLPEHLAPDLLDRLRTRLAPFQLIEGWGVDIEGLGPGTAVLKVAAGSRITNPGSSIINGGVLATLADMVCALALSTVFDGAMPFVTSDLHIRYLEPAQGNLQAEATVLRLSPRSAILDSRIRSEEGVVALCTCHFTLRPRVGGSPG